jgi:hypothetical protein
MRSSPAATVGLLLGLALTLPGCGEERASTTETTKATADRAAPPPVARVSAGAVTPKRRSAAKQCSRLLTGVLDPMESLDNIAAVGTDYDSYLGAVSHVRSGYAHIAAADLSVPCLTLVAAPIESALNIYIDAANTWGDCLATAACNPASMEPELQRKWGEASELLSEAQSSLRDLG